MNPPTLDMRLEQESGSNILKFPTFKPTNTIRCFFKWWLAIEQGFQTRKQWQNEGRRVRGDEPRTAVMIPEGRIPREEDHLREITVNRIDQQFRGRSVVSLFRRDQTVLVQRRPRTIAQQAMWHHFGQLMDGTRCAEYVADANKWVTRTQIGKWRPFADNDLRQHVDGQKILGVFAKPDGFTRFIIIDHDFHGRDRDVFLEQEEILFRNLLGSGWHHQIARDDVDGIHHICVWNNSVKVKAATEALRRCLRKLDQMYPTLAKRAAACGMPTFSNLEIYPSATRAVRLPMSKGRLLFIDRPLEPITVKGKSVQDVESYAKWLECGERPRMKPEDILDQLYLNLGPSYRQDNDTKLVAKDKNKTTLNSNVPPSGFGSLRGQCRQKITDFWSGTFNPPNSLNTAIVVSARIMFFEEVPEGWAVELLSRWVREIPAEARGCSQRLVDQQWAEIDREIRKVIRKAYGGNSGQAESGISTVKLEAAVRRWATCGFRLHDKSTWDNCWSGWERVENFKFSKQEEVDVRAYLLPVLKCKDEKKAVEVAWGVIKLAAVKEMEGNGIADTYWRAFLADEFDIAMGDYNKLYAIKEAILALELVRKISEPMYFEDGRKGVATRYAVGDKYRGRVSSPAVQAAEPGLRPR